MTKLRPLFTRTVVAPNSRELRRELRSRGYRIGRGAHTSIDVTVRADGSVTKPPRVVHKYRLKVTQRDVEDALAMPAPLDVGRPGFLTYTIERDGDEWLRVGCTRARVFELAHLVALSDHAVRTPVARRCRQFTTIGGHQLVFVEKDGSVTMPEDGTEPRSGVRAFSKAWLQTEHATMGRR